MAVHLTAALTALAAPRLLGDLVEAVDEGTTTAHVDRLVMLLAGFLLAQSVLTRYAQYASQVFGERILAELREDFVDAVLDLPIGMVESAGSGDLLTRTSRDVDQLGWAARWAVPQSVVSGVRAVVVLTAALWVGWWVSLALLPMVPATAGRSSAASRRSRPSWLAWRK